MQCIWGFSVFRIINVKNLCQLSIFRHMCQRNENETEIQPERWLISQFHEKLGGSRANKWSMFHESILVADLH